METKQKNIYTYLLLLFLIAFAWLYLSIWSNHQGIIPGVEVRNIEEINIRTSVISEARVTSEDTKLFNTLSNFRSFERPVQEGGDGVGRNNPFDQQ